MGNVKIEGENKVHGTQGGKGQPVDYGVAEMKDITWKIPKTTALGGMRNNVNQRMDINEVKNQ